MARSSRPAAAQAKAATALQDWLGGRPLPERWHVVLGVVLPMALVLAGAWRVRAFVVDDAYISFRYAENLAAGHGLVYNVGERVEGYTNFLWTVLLAVLARFGASVPTASKVLGALLSAGSLWPLFLLARRLRPLGSFPTLATWLCASSFVYTGYAVFGLEAPLFIALTLTGTELFWRECDREDGPDPHSEATAWKTLPYSGLLFALAMLTRPEALVLFALLVVSRGRQAISKDGRMRLALFALPVATHLVWRRSYYGAWLPNTLAAKTGDIADQVKGGRDYLEKYVAHAGTFLWLGLGSIAASVVALTGDGHMERARRARIGLAIGAFTVLFGVYVILVGGDWMPYFRFVGPVEPFAFLLVDDAVRALLERRERAVTLAVGAFAIWTTYTRVTSLREAQTSVLANDKTFWDDSAGRTATWFLEHTEPGPIAIADIGYVGYRTGYPIVDMLGLLAPEIARLPGGYTKKVGDGFTDAIFARAPRYFVIISSSADCKSPTVPSSRAAQADPRFKQYPLLNAIHLKGGGTWCIFGK